MVRGSEFNAEVHSADASSGVAIPLRTAGSTGTVTLGTQIPAVTDVSLISAAGGDVKIESFNADGTLTLVRGTIAANGSIIQNLVTPFFGLRGGTLRLTAPSGVVDVSLSGFLTR